METSLDEKSKLKAYELFETGFIENIEVGTVKGLQQIHSYIFGGLYDFAGKIRTLNISKGDFVFTPVKYLQENLIKIEKMSENSLDQILKKNLNLCVDWSKINKQDYFDAMITSPNNPIKILN